MPIKEGCSEACSKLRCSSGVWAGAAFTAIFVGSIALMVVVTYNHKKSLDRNYEWWQRTVIYHIFTPSFFDENNDGFGDLKDLRIMTMFCETETSLLTTTWAMVETDMQSHGLKFFQHMFTEHPEVQTQFFFMMSVGDVDKLAKHGVKVLNDVGDLVQLVEKKDDGKLVEKIRSITKSHAKRGVDVPNFKVVSDSLLEYLTLALGDNLNKEGKRVWKKLLDTLVIVVEQEMDRVGSQ